MPSEYLLIRSVKSSVTARPPEVGGPPPVREKLIEPRDGVGADAQQDIGKVLDGIHAVGFARGEQGHQRRQVLPRLIVTHEEVVLSTQGERPESSFTGVVIKRVSASHWLRVYWMASPIGLSEDRQAAHKLSVSPSPPSIHSRALSRTPPSRGSAATTTTMYW